VARGASNDLPINRLSLDTDEDVTRFEIKLSDIARRFKNLEALQKVAAPPVRE